MAGCEELGFSAFFTRPVTLGRGWARMAHGRFPVPPPAVLKLLQGVEVRDPELEGECTTPTGAALLRALDAAPAPAAFTPLRSGFGAGARDDADRPNCLRLIEAEVPGSDSRELSILQADVDDLPPEYLPALLDGLRDAGALDCSAAPLLMKKARLGTRIEALVAPPDLERVRTALFRGSTTIGMRWWRVERAALARSEEEVRWRGQPVRLKRSQLPGGGERVKPEYADVVRAAQALGMTPLDAYRALRAEGLAGDAEDGSSEPRP